jgi:hypothetical protein
LLAFGVALRNLPGSWPVTTGSSRSSIRWSVDRGRAFTASPRWWVRETTDGAIVHFHDEAEFRVRTSPPAEVRVTLGPANEEEAALSFVLAGLPLALPLFELEPFHGAGLEIEDGSAVLVLGEPEAGKSTTAAALRARELRFLADDACAIDEAGMLWPGAPLLAARVGGEDTGEFARYDGKSVTAIPHHDVTPREVAASVVLRPGTGSDVSVKTIQGREAITALLGQTRSPRVLASRRERLQFECAVRLARGRAGVVSYDKGSHTPGHVADAILRWIGG